MAKFHGEIGYVISTETAPGVWTDVVTKRNYYGDVIRESRRWSEANKVNDDLVLNNRISIIANDFALMNLSEMRFVKWSGKYWKISSFEVQRPRIILSLGGVYNGNTS